MTGGRFASVTVMVKAALASPPRPSVAVTAAGWAFTAASAATVPEICPEAADQARPAGRPVTETVGVSPSGSETVMPKAAIVSPRR